MEGNYMELTNEQWDRLVKYGVMSPIHIFMPTEDGPIYMACNDKYIRADYSDRIEIATRFTEEKAGELVETIWLDNESIEENGDKL
ncbi:MULTISPECIES: hypothetical protein [Bacteroidales]|uniref:hypothetical protein n=2 Tax=Bacteroidia TaxID=200643 RepID=UPI0022E0B80C|nr:MULTISPECIES: hypothetical protein [Bacteroidales]